LFKNQKFADIIIITGRVKVAPAEKFFRLRQGDEE
jgi:hypothetical protein